SANYEESGLSLSEMSSPNRHSFSLPRSRWMQPTTENMHRTPDADDEVVGFWPSDPESLIFARSSKYFTMSSDLNFHEVVERIQKNGKFESEQLFQTSAAFRTSWGYVRVVDLDGLDQARLGLHDDFFELVNFTKRRRFVFSVFPFAFRPIDVSRALTLCLSVFKSVAGIFPSGEFCFGNALHKLSSRELEKIIEGEDLFSACVTLVKHLDAEDVAIGEKIFTEGFCNFGFEEFIIKHRSDQEKYLIDFVDEMFEAALRGIDLERHFGFESRTFGLVQVEQVFSTTYNRVVNTIDLRENREKPEYGAKYGFAQSYVFDRNGRSE
ncbi:hypothetical protein, partial [Ruegeria sp. HKCCA5929]|uniref:hypothetical protein n=1 Tax=Ruegeria sp. HKCCA5929 TaxID=2682988 RepID=UPI001C2BEC2F